MEKLDSYKVDLKGMPSDTTSYQWCADDEFFSAVQGSEIRQGRLDVSLRVCRTSGAYELWFRLKGTVKVTCDRCLELMDFPIDAEHGLRVKLGGEYADDGELVTVPETEGVVNVAWNIYEFARLEIPLRHVHPSGGCNETMSGLLQAMTPSASVDEDDTPTDPRWNDLKKILNKQ